MKTNKAQLCSLILPQSIFLYRKRSADKRIYLTFDDGPHETVTLKLLELLDTFSIKATFFCVGENLQKYPKIVNRIIKDNHTLGNHSFTHRGFGRLHLSDQIDEFRKTEVLLQEITGRKNHLFRAPQGHWNVRLMYSLFSLGVTCVHWSIDSLDYLKQYPEQQVQRLREQNMRNGEIILFHDDHETSLKILTELIPYWKSSGYIFEGL